MYVYVCAHVHLYSPDSPSIDRNSICSTWLDIWPKKPSSTIETLLSQASFLLDKFLFPLRDPRANLLPNSICHSIILMEYGH